MSLLSGVFEIHDNGGSMHEEYTSRVPIISLDSEYKRTYGNKKIYVRVNQSCKRKSANR
jgi:hypothetical protein